MGSLKITTNISEKEFMEGCLNQAHQLNYDMSLVIGLYALARSWHVDKLMFLMNECVKDEKSEGDKE